MSFKQACAEFSYALQYFRACSMATSAGRPVWQLLACHQQWLVTGLSRTSYCNASNKPNTEVGNDTEGHGGSPHGTLQSWMRGLRDRTGELTLGPVAVASTCKPALLQNLMSSSLRTIEEELFLMRSEKCIYIYIYMYVRTLLYIHILHTLHMHGVACLDRTRCLRKDFVARPHWKRSPAGKHPRRFR